MPIISNTQPASILPIHLDSPAAAPQSLGPEGQLSKLNAQYPNLEAAIKQAQTELESVQGSDSWAGLQWFEKAIFFIPPFGPLIGVMMLDANKDMIRNSEQKLSQLLEVAEHKASLESQIAALMPDRFVA